MKITKQVFEKIEEKRKTLSKNLKKRKREGDLGKNEGRLEMKYFLHIIKDMEWGTFREMKELVWERESSWLRQTSLRNVGIFDDDKIKIIEISFFFLFNCYIRLQTVAKNNYKIKISYIVMAQ